MYSKKIRLILLALIITASGCGGSDADNSQEQNLEGDQDVPQIGNSETDTYEGSWARECSFHQEAPNSNGGMTSIWIKETLTISNDSYERESQLFGDSICSEDNKFLEFADRGPIYDLLNHSTDNNDEIREYKVATEPGVVYSFHHYLNDGVLYDVGIAYDTEPGEPKYSEDKVYEILYGTVFTRVE